MTRPLAPVSVKMIPAPLELVQIFHPFLCAHPCLIMSFLSINSGQWPLMRSETKFKRLLSDPCLIIVSNWLLLLRLHWGCHFPSFYIFWLRGAAVVVWWQAPKLCSRWSSQLGIATWHRRHWHRVHTEPFHRGIQLPQNWRHGHCLSIECGYFLRSKVQQFIWTQISRGTSTIVTEREWWVVYSWQKQKKSPQSQIDT